MRCTRRAAPARVARRSVTILCAAALTAASGACTTTGQTAQPAERGALISATPVAEMDAEQVATYLEGFGLDASHVRSGVAAHQIVYRTIDTNGAPTTASGLVALPVNDERELRVVAWLHGTTVYRRDVASVNPESPDRAAAFMFAAAGYATSAPDYLGLGLGPGFHPYDDAASTATASVDALRATRALLERSARRLDERVLISGFSQGGNGAMALGRALQQGADADMSVGALAPISGPYDVSGTLETAVTSGIEHVAPYVAYLTVAWHRVHHLYDAPSDAFRAPYDETVEDLFDGHHTGDQIFEALPATLEELFTPQFLDHLRHPTGTLLEALQEADSTCDWRPGVPVHLYASTGDRDVPIANAHHCQELLEAQGAETRLVDFGEVDHGTSVTLSLPKVVEQFAALEE
ncbi:alpha/beta hydrolase family protein [Sorangium sp. So ce233]|uniref:alpha/beta hydrolase family protein n=1 Tax=Sorangium sp. So ce233 TaxID=3133290 RepID=UPI003F5EACFD